MFIRILEDIWRSSFIVKQLPVMFIVRTGGIRKRGSCKRYCSSGSRSQMFTEKVILKTRRKTPVLESLFEDVAGPQLY